MLSLHVTFLFASVFALYLMTDGSHVKDEDKVNFLKRLITDGRLRHLKKLLQSLKARKVSISDHNLEILNNKRTDNNIPTRGNEKREYEEYVPNCGSSSLYFEKCPDLTENIENFALGMIIYAEDRIVQASSDDVFQRKENKDMNHDHHLKSNQSSTQTVNTMKRNMDKNAILWTKSIPYTFVNMSSGEQKFVKEAIEVFQKQTCLSFRPKTDNDTDYLVFDGSPGQGCASYVGKIGGAQSVSLSTGSCDETQTAIHEIMHAIGQHHEQSRRDRPPYLRVRWSVVPPSYIDNNGPEDVVDIGDHYDPYSTLQYQLKAGSPDDKKVLILTDPRLDYLADMTYKTLSHTDVYEIVKAYGCSSSCGSTKCENAGFPRKTYNKKQCHCKCVDGLKGSTCNEIDASCGGIINLKENETKVIKAPTGNNTSKYKTGVKCIYLVKGPKGTRIKATVDKMDLSYSLNKKLRVCHHYIGLNFDLISQPAFKQCGKIPNQQINQLTFFKSVSEEANLMKFQFDSRPEPPTGATEVGEGFTITVTAFKSKCLSQPCRFPSKCKDSADLKSKICECKPGSGYSGPNCNDVEASATVRCDMETDIPGNCMFRRDKTSAGEFREAAYNNLANGKKMLAKNGKIYATAVSQGESPTDRPRLITTVNFEPGPRCLKFYFFIRKALNDESKTTYRVYSSDASGAKKKIWERTESNNGDWEAVSLPITNTTGLKLEIEADVGEAENGIDDLIVQPSCDSNVSNVCTPNPCKNSGICNVNGASYNCQCGAGYTGKDCSAGIPSNPCSPSPCGNGGSCKITGSSYVCTCTAGFSGQNCSIENPCSPNPCKNQGTCQSSGSFYWCECQFGFTGAKCGNSIPSSPCSPSPCDNGGSCNITGSSYVCTCADGFSGQNCSIENPCSPNPCKNQGTCKSSGMSYWCECQSGFTGAECGKIDKCSPNPCKNDAECITNGSGYTCQCLVYNGVHYFTGNNCETGMCINDECYDASSCAKDDECNLCNVATNTCIKDETKDCAYHDDCA